MSKNAEKKSFFSRLNSMLKADFRRMFTTPLYYIMVGVSLVIPILIFVMTTMMDGTISVNPTTGEETVMEGFKNVWQIIGAISGDSSAMMAMDITSMCNINMMFFLVAVFVCIFVSDDFRSGYAKNLFTIKAKKDDYVVSKSIVGFVAGASMIIAFFIGALIGGAISGLSFAMQGINVYNIVMSMLSKVLLVSIFSSIFLLASVIAKQKLWLSIILSLGIGMLMFTMIPIISPLNAGVINVILCLVGGGIFSAGIGVGSYYILKKTSII
ncbi:MAG: hypothetical protein E7361_00555 [Clostridiales bacterium]|nr:hypothetical protein [Clostridiales bacterium]